VAQHEFLLTFGTASYALAFFLVIVFRKRLSPLHERHRLLAGAAVLSGIGLALISFNGMAFMGSAGSVAGVSLSSMASAVLLMAWGELYGSLDLRHAWVGVSGSILLGAALYATVTWSGQIAPIVTAVFLACCPMLSLAALFAAWENPNVHPLDADVQRRPFRIPSTLMLGIFACGFSIGFMVVLSADHAAAGGSGAGLINALCIAAISSLILLYAPFEHTFSLSFLYWFVLLLLSAGFMLLPVAGYAYAATVTVIGYACLEICWILVCSNIAYRVPLPVLASMGWGAFASYSGALAGGLGSAILLGSAPLSVWQLSVVSIVMVGMLMLGSVFLLREAALPSLWGLLRETVQPLSDVPEGLVQTRSASVAESHGLTPREQEILILLAKGQAPDDIAKALVISEATVRTHAKRLYEKLDVHSQPQLIKMVVFDSQAGEPEA
jgi:DNA-binding CsgD family transcriptional regulator